MSSVPYHTSELDDDTISDFVDSLRDEIEDISAQLLSLEREPGNKDMINALFRSVHSVKGNCRMCFLEPFSNFVHAIEEVMSEVRSGRLSFTPTLGEAISLSLDHLKMRSEDLRRCRETDIGLLESSIPLFTKAKTASVTDADALMEAAIRLYAGEVIENLPLHSHQLATPPSPETSGTTSNESVSDIRFFAEMATLIDSTSPHWENRSIVQLSIATGINLHLSTKVDPHQLTAAIYLHDLGMKFLPQDLVNKNQRFNPLEEKRLHQHVRWSHEWLKRLPNWQEAATMVLQHHERPDGNGYPQGLSANAIHNGAQVIAIADAFFSLTNERSDRSYKKSLMRAITEINSYRDIQFKGEVVDAFNHWIREIYRTKDD